MDSAQMVSAHKKKESIENRRGRPAKGSLSTYPKDLVDQVKELREQHEGWGAINIYVELVEEYDYFPSSLPSIPTINRYLKENGHIKAVEPSRKLPSSSKCTKKAKRPHDLWELDAQGATKVAGLGYQALINIKDVISKLHCQAFPVGVKNSKTQPSTKYYYWTLRLAFLQWGLPRVIQVDKDSVFYENRSKSPFPKKLQLWLIGLGVELCFIDKPPPQKNPTVERSHQTMERQVITGQSYGCWKYFFHYCNKRRKRMNEKIPNRMLDGQAPLEAFPQAAHSTRNYSLEQEQQSIDFKRIYRYLAKGEWFRKVSNVKTLSLGHQIYYLKNAKPGSQMQIKFCNRAKKLVFRDANELLVDKRPVKNLSVENLMGGSTKLLMSTKYKLFHFRACPL